MADCADNQLGLEKLEVAQAALQLRDGHACQRNKREAR